MANHEWTRPGGIWNADTDLLAAELADLDAKTVDSISSSGGIYVLTEDLEIGGAPGATVTFTTPFFATEAVQFLDRLIVDGNAYFSSDVQVGSGDGSFFRVNAETEFTRLATFDDGAIFDGETSFNQNANFYDFVNITDGCYFGGGGTVTFAIGTNPQFEDPVDFDQAVSFNGEITAIGGCTFSVGSVLFSTGADATFNAPVTFNASVAISGAVQLNRPMTMAGTGAIAQRVLTGNDTDDTFSPLSVHEVVMESGVLSGSSFYYIDDTGCVDGNEILFGNKDATAQIDVRKLGSGSTIKGLLKAWGRFVRIGGTWRLTQYGAFP